MTCYIVSFEIQTKKKRLEMHAALKEFGSFCPISSNCWAVLSTETAVEVGGKLSPCLGPEDRLFVIRSGTEAAWWNSYGEKNNTWLQENL